MKLKGLEVADQDVARPVALCERVKILPGLTVGFRPDRGPRFFARR